MPIDVEIVPASRLVVTRFRAVITDRELGEAYTAIVRHPQTEPGFVELCLVDDSYAPQVTAAGLTEQARIYADFHGEKGARSGRPPSWGGPATIRCFDSSRIRSTAQTRRSRIWRSSTAQKPRSTTWGSMRPPSRSLRTPSSRLHCPGGSGRAARTPAVRRTGARRSRRVHKALFDTANAIGVFDLDTWKMAECNQALVDLLGYTAAELAALRLEDLDILDTEDDVRARIARIVKTSFETFETKYRTEDGRILDLHVTATHVRVGSRDCVQGIFLDLTERKARQREILRQNRALARTTAGVEEALQQARRAEAETTRSQQIVDVVARIQSAFITERVKRARHDR